MSKIAHALLTLFLAVLLTAGCTNAVSAAPDAALQSLSGESTSIAELNQGKPLYLNFWASWCGPCVSELPDVDALAQEYGDRITSAAISVDDNTADARAYIERAGLTLKVYTGNINTLNSGYDLSAIPVSVLIDPNGNILARHVGSMSRSELEEFLQPAL